MLQYEYQIAVVDYSWDRAIDFLLFSQKKIMSLQCEKVAIAAVG
jgi:hypothetical protein